METLYHQTKQLVDEVQGSKGFARLEMTSGPDVHLVENEIQAMIDRIVSNCDRLDILVHKEHPSHRAAAKYKLDQLKYDCQHLQASMRQIQHGRYRREEDERQREELMSRSFTTNAAASETSLYMDYSLKHHSQLQNTNSEMDNLIGSGTSILDNMRDQRSTLKGAHKKILDVANTLGLSNTVMRLIERRTTQDKFILYGGMILICIVMFLLWRYFS